MSARNILARLALATTLLVPAAASAASADDFIKDAVKANISEVKLGHLAQQRGSTEAVRSFGRMLIEDHTTAAGEAVTVAKQIKVPVKQVPSDEGEKFYEKASQLRGKSFDSEFAAHMIEDHRKDIEAYTEQANDGSNTAVAAFAAKTLPVLEKHLAAAEQLQKQ
jgi:putative membrane protein